MSIIYQGRDPLTRKPLLLDQETGQLLDDPRKFYGRRRRTRTPFTVILRILVYHWWGVNRAALGSRLADAIGMGWKETGLLFSPNHIFTDDYLNDLKKKVWPHVAILRLKGDL